MSSVYEQAGESLKSIRLRTQSTPRVGIVLGTGLGGLVEHIEVETEIAYSDIPNFRIPTVETHDGKLIFGKADGVEIVAMQGRFHQYEGYSMREITFPIRVFKLLGVEILLISNAAGGMNPYYRSGELMIIEDHINLLGDNPLIGPNEDDFGPRFPDMSEAYSTELIRMAEDIALENNIKIHKGVYVAVSGPNLETRAEYRMLRNMGADAVGMSSIPENIVGNHMGMKVFGISAITDECFPDALKPANVETIVKMAGIAEPKMTKIMFELIKKLDRN